MKPLQQHINDHHGGNKAAFARAVGTSPQMVQQWKRQGFWVTVEGFVINPNTTKRDPSHITTQPDAP